MTTKEILQIAMKKSINNTTSYTHLLQIKPGLSEAEIADLEARLGTLLSPEILELLTFTSGFRFEAFGEVSFFPKGLFGLEDVLPRGLPVAQDDCGNPWVVDVRPDNGEWGPILFMSHDPPVAIIQAPNLAAFVEQILDLARPDQKNMFEYVTSVAVDRVWGKDPYLLDIQSARNSKNDLLSTFSKNLPDNFRVADLRDREVGSGFTLWRGGQDPKIKRCGYELIFGVGLKAKNPFLSRLVKR